MAPESTPSSKPGSPLSLGTVLLIYNILVPFLLIVGLPGLLIKMWRRGNYGADFLQRFGIYRTSVRKQLTSLDHPIWVNAVSVGETLIAQKLLRELRENQPETPLILSVTTSTGYAVAQEKCGDLVDAVIYYPLDLPFVAKRALNLIQPSQIVLMEAEVWPNFVAIAKERGIPISMVNARMSPRSGRRFAKFRRFVEPIFKLIDQVAVQDSEDAKRYEEIGVSSERITHTGSIKFDQTHTENLPQIAEFRELMATLWQGTPRRVLMAASTHAGEEKLLGETFLQLKKSHPDLFYMVVPRHFERASEIVQELNSIGLTPALRTDLGNAPKDADTLIINTTGELKAWYHLAEIVVIGKSYLSTGGQNPVEAIAAGKPVIFGPHMENFAILTETLLRTQGAIQADSTESLQKEATRLLNSPEHAAQVALKGQEALASHTGATQRTVELLKKIAK